MSDHIYTSFMLQNSIKFGVKQNGGLQYGLCIKKITGNTPMGSKFP